MLEERGIVGQGSGAKAREVIPIGAHSEIEPSEVEMNNIESSENALFDQHQR
jgi:hypothetical protein